MPINFIMHKNIQTYAQTHTHTQTHAHAQTHAHININAQAAQPSASVHIYILLSIYNKMNKNSLLVPNPLKITPLFLP